MRRLINQRPGRGGALMLSMMPFILLACAYLYYSHARLADNPGDKLLPAPATIAATMHQYAFEEDERSGDRLLWTDTEASLERLLSALAISAVVGLSLGLAIGVLPYLRAAIAPFVAALSLIPPLAVLPILFIAVGLGEAAKITLIVIGVAPIIVRDIAMRTAELPTEQIIKAQTLGASTWQIVIRVVLPQMWPRLIDALRLSLGSAWLFLIAAEAIASTEGLGYRIFLVRRYLAMDVILPYVAWITLLAFGMDWLLRQKLVLPSHSHGLRALIERAAAKKKLQLDVQLEADSFRVLTSLVEAGLGYTLLPPSSVRGEIRERRLETATISGQAPMRELLIASPLDHPDSTATSVITALLRSETGACRDEGLWNIKLA